MEKVRSPKIWSIILYKVALQTESQVVEKQCQMAWLCSFGHGSQGLENNLKRRLSFENMWVLPMLAVKSKTMGMVGLHNMVLPYVVTVRVPGIVRFLEPYGKETPRGWRLWSIYRYSPSQRKWVRKGWVSLGGVWLGTWWLILCPWSLRCCQWPRRFLGRKRWSPIEVALVGRLPAVCSILLSAGR